MNDPIGSGKQPKTPASHLRTLRRRREYLQDRIERHELGSRRSGGDFDRAEFHALEWAITELERQLT